MILGEESELQPAPDVYHVELTEKERAIVLHALNELPVKGETGLAMLLGLIRQFKDASLIDAEREWPPDT